MNTHITPVDGQEFVQMRDGVYRLTNAHLANYHDNAHYASRGTLSDLARMSPRSALAPKKKSEETDAMRFGRVYHALLLEPEVFELQYQVLDKDQRPVPEKDFRTKANKEWKDAIIQEAHDNNRTLIDSFEVEKARHMIRALKKTTDIDAYMTRHGTREMAYFVDEFPFHNPITGEQDTAPVRVLVDYHDDALIIDPKTHGDIVEPRTFLSKCYKHGYHIQGALYRDVVQHVIGYHDPAVMPFYFFVQEKEPPYSAGTFELSSDLADLGVAEYSMALALWKKYHELDLDNLPTYNNGGREMLEPLPWCAFETDERVARMAQFAREEK